MKLLDFNKYSRTEEDCEKYLKTYREKKDLYHGIKHEFLQKYLNESCHKFNRRYFEDKTFERLVLASVQYRPTFKHRTYKCAVVCG